MPNPSRTSIEVRELDCAAEEQVLRKSVGTMPGVSDLAFDVMNRRMIVEHDPDRATAEAIAARVRSVGMTPVVPKEGPTGTKAPTDASGPVWPEVQRRVQLAVVPVASKREMVLLGTSGVLAFAAEVVAWSSASEHTWPVLLLSAAAVLLGGLPTLRKGLIALRTITLNINFLMTIAVVGAFAIGEYPEAAMVVFLFAVAELIEKYSLERARHAVRALMEMAPETAYVKQPDGSWKETPADEVPVGAVVRVRPGERLPLDGVVVAGESAVNQAPITGESVPVDKAEGSQVFAGTINESGVLEFKVKGGKDQTTLARIIRTVQEAQAVRAPTQRFVDRFARAYTPTVVVLAILVALVPPLLFQQPWMRWVYEALVLLVIACPCALVISTPVTVVSGLASAARRGILVKGGVYLEEGRKLSVIAVDKTGTITEGKPRVQGVKALHSLDPDTILRIAASVDAGSDHPVARAVTATWTREKIEAVGPLFPVQQFTSVTGKGVTGRIDGTPYFLGNHRYAHERGVCTPAVESVLGELEAKGQTAVVLTNDRAALGVIAVADAPRESSIEAVRQLHAMGLRTVMLSGDNQRTAEAIAKTVGIDDARGELLPEDKVAAVKQLNDQWGHVGMVGDGVNDAPALAEASIGIAMGAAGTDTALEVADVALMRDDLSGVPAFFQLSRRTARVLRQNIAVALGIKAVFFILALVGLATLWMAVVADMGASLLVVGNGLRLLRYKSGKGPAALLARSTRPRRDTRQT
ncbi:MAG: cadmium-translocating P-type ATPase [Phycisphaerae bacterium]|nr:MAG: cadmium-translocating P-type ATPase [Phycisphaerae bacterium]